MDELTIGEKIFLYLRHHIKVEGYPPSLRDIGTAVGLTSTASVAHQLTKLDTAGVVRITPNVSRGITLLVETYHEPRGKVKS